MDTKIDNFKEYMKTAWNWTKKGASLPAHIRFGGNKTSSSSSSPDTVRKGTTNNNNNSNSSQETPEEQVQILSMTMSTAPKEVTLTEEDMKRLEEQRQHREREETKKKKEQEKQKAAEAMRKKFEEDMRREKEELDRQMQAFRLQRTKQLNFGSSDSLPKVSTLTETSPNQSRSNTVSNNNSSSSNNNNNNNGSNNSSKTTSRIVMATRPRDSRLKRAQTTIGNNRSMRREAGDA